MNCAIVIFLSALTFGLCRSVFNMIIEKVSKYVTSGFSSNPLLPSTLPP